MTALTPITFTATDIDQIATQEGRVAIFVAPEGPLDAGARRVNKLTRGAVQRLMDGQKFAKSKPGEAFSLAFPVGMAAEAVDIVHLPRRTDVQEARKAGAALAKLRGRAELLLIAANMKYVAEVCFGLVMRDYGFDDHKTEAKERSGAVVAMHMAKARPDLFERVVLVEPFAFAPWFFRIFLIPVLGRFFYWNAFENPLGRLIVDRAMRDQATEGRDLMEGFDATAPKTALSYLDLVTRVKDPMFFAGLEMPIELVFGAQTMQAIKTSIGIWRGVWPKANVYQVEGAGHLLLQESPEMVGGILQASCASWSAHDSSAWRLPG